MHGTRYISRICPDLTFEVYNLYPDVVYPGRIIRVDIQVVGELEEDKKITIEIEIHQSGDLDKAQMTVYDKAYNILRVDFLELTANRRTSIQNLTWTAMEWLVFPISLFL